MATATATANTPKVRSQIRTIIGQVTSAKTAKTIKVEVQYQTKHAKYGKYLKRSSVYYVHDEKGAAHEGDIVEIAECRPMSRTKHHFLLRIVTKAPEKITHDTGDDVTHASGKKSDEAKKTEEKK